VQEIPQGTLNVAMVLTSVAARKTYAVGYGSARQRRLMQSRNCENASHVDLVVLTLDLHTDPITATVMLEEGSF
jgi:hypothetical protein